MVYIALHLHVVKAFWNSYILWIQMKSINENLKVANACL
jgi:hypothetical protein